MSEIKVNSIKGVAASVAALSINNTDGTCTANLTNRTNKNLILNGAFLIAQRGTSSTTSGYGTVDRFKVTYSGTNENPTQAQVDVASGTTPYTSGFRKALKITNGNQTGGAGATDHIRIVNIIEGQDIANSGWNYKSASSFITLSFWVKSSVAQNFYGFIRDTDGTAYQYPFETGSLTADTWTKITKTIPGNSNLTFNNDNGGAWELYIHQFAGTDETASGVTLNAWTTYSGTAKMPDFTSTWYTTNNATFEITGVQLEVGSVATDFEHRSFGEELLLCQRYYLVWADTSTAGEDEPIGSAWYNAGSYSFLTDCRFPVEMRAHPSVISKNATNAFRAYGGGAGGAYFDQMNYNEQITTRMARVGGTVSLNTSNAGVGIRAHTSGSGYLHFNAEL